MTLPTPDSGFARTASELPTRFLMTPALQSRFGERAALVGAQLLRGDPLADDAVAELRKLSRPEAHAHMDTGARRGFVALPNELRALRMFFESQEQTPAWADAAAARRGGELMLRMNYLGGLSLAAKSIVLGYASPGGNKPLVLAGGLTGRAAMRLNETGRYVRGVIRQGGLERFADGYAASCKVRLMHAQVRALLQGDPRWNTADFGLPINQHDMAATTILFSLAVLEALEALGLTIPTEEAEDFIHLWRHAGHLMGVDACILPACRRDAVRLSEVIMATQGPPDDDARKLTRALINAGADAARTAQERRDVKRGVVLLRAGAYLMLGGEMAKALGFEPTAWSIATPLVKRLVVSTERLQRGVPFGRAKAIAAGERYWDEVHKRGIALYDLPFQLPDALVA